MAVLTAPTGDNRTQTVIGNDTLYTYNFTTAIDNGDTFAIPEPTVIIAYWFQPTQEDVVSQSVSISSSTVTFQLSISSSGRLFVLGGTR